MRLVILSDFHAGSVVGLTPPQWQFEFKHSEKTKRDKFSIVQEVCWNYYADTIKKLKPIDILVVNGDCIDGRGEKSGSTELITSDQYEQCEIASNIIRRGVTKGTRIVMTYGTAYHASPDGNDWENVIADDVKADKIGSHEWLNVKGTVFDIKHHVGSTGTPVGVMPLTRERVWNILWNEHSDQPKADVMIRSHVHRYTYIGGPNWLGITTPALCAPGSKYGARRCSGIVHFGLVHFDISNNGSYTWQAHIARPPELRAHTLKF